jgi:hypothetical protein
MTSITITDLLTTIFVLVDDWYQDHGKRFLFGKVGSKPEFSDSEVMTLVLAMEFIPFPSETQFLGFIRANYLDLFPKLLDQSQFNRRARSLRLLIEQLRRSWLIELGVTRQRFFLLDTKPVPVVGVKRSNRHSDFAGSAGYGRCASRSLTYFGYKLVALTTLEGLPVAYDLVSAQTSEWDAAEVVLGALQGCHVIADKGFVSDPWQEFIYEQTGNRIWTQKRANQYCQNPPALDRFLKSARERIEGVFHELTDTGRNLEKLLAKTVIGLSTRIIAKLTSHALRHLLELKFGFKVQTFELAVLCN